MYKPGSMEAGLICERHFAKSLSLSTTDNLNLHTYQISVVCRFLVAEHTSSFQVNPKSSNDQTLQMGIGKRSRVMLYLMMLGIVL
jgi:DNA mismatch repair protein MutH